ncbi:hypothetical protein A2U01_0106627, partial [Trifolium medium]|nr:hypothetical protein [Trifolium medium]
MAGVNDNNIPEQVAENNFPYGPPHPQDGQLASVTENDEQPVQEPYVP